MVVQLAFQFLEETFLWIHNAGAAFAGMVSSGKMSNRLKNLLDLCWLPKLVSVRQKGVSK